MSARDKLRSCFPALPPGRSNDLIEAAVDEILAEHAHELAERVRAVCHDAYDPGEEGVCQISGWTAADVIDVAWNHVSSPSRVTVEGDVR